MIRRILLVVLFCIGSLPAGYASSEELSEEVRVDLLEIWVKVTDHQNRPVVDLEGADFELYLDGKKAATRCFDKDFRNYLDPDLDSEKTFKRKYIFFFDLLNTNAADMSFAKKQIVAFMENTFLEETDEGMIFALLPTMHLGVVQKMTSNKQALIDVVDKMRGNPTLNIRARNNEKELLQVLYSTGQSGSAVAGGSPGGARRGRTSVETVRQARGLARSFARLEENYSRLTLDALLSVTGYLHNNRFPGRLVMIYVSGGFSIRPGQNYYQMVDRAIEDQMVVGSEDLAFHDYPSSDLERDMLKMLGKLNRLNVTIYAVDSNGLNNVERGADLSAQQVSFGTRTTAFVDELKDSLTIMAGETGGIAVINTQNYAVGLAEIADDMEGQYWLCTNIPRSKSGSSHKIDVKVARTDVKVRHRKGFIE